MRYVLTHNYKRLTHIFKIAQVMPKKELGNYL